MLSKLYTWLYGQEEIKVIIVGLDNAGKTTTLYKLYGRMPMHRTCANARTADGPLHVRRALLVRPTQAIKRGRGNHTHHRVQCGRVPVPQLSLPHVGHWRAGEPAAVVVDLLRQHPRTRCGNTAVAS